jgi:cytochrome c oxidase assembly protein subunit 11
MPVFFYIDPEILDDWQMKNVTNITLSYTFFPSTHQEEDENEETDEKSEGVQA